MPKMLMILASLVGTCGGVPLEWLGADPSSLAVCQGDCDDDGECPGTSVCVQRTSGLPADVEGCTTGDSGSSDRAGTDYCSNPVVTSTPTTSMTLSSSDQGAKFDKCIKISDWESKTLSEEIEVSDRDSAGCCPSGTVPGVKHYSNYVGAQVVCGFTNDGSITFSTSGGDTCTYNQCYVWKQDLECSGGGKQLLNGCCAAPADCGTGACGFKDKCENYAYSMSNVHSQSSEYCLTYHSTYQMENTADTTDDQADNKLKVNDKVYYYTACEGSSGGGSPSPAPNVDLATRGGSGVGMVALLASMIFMV